MRRTRYRLRTATLADGPELLRLWALLFDEADAAGGDRWRGHARRWFAQLVTDPGTARFPVIDIGGQIVATAIGTLELGVPNPQRPRGRTVRLANVITLPEHRGAGDLRREDARIRPAPKTLWPAGCCGPSVRSHADPTDRPERRRCAADVLRRELPRRDGRRP